MLVVEQFESLAVFGVATVDFGLPNTPLAGRKTESCE